MGRMTSRLTRWFNKGKRAMSPMQITALVFAGLILLGACLLMLPVSTRSGEGCDFLSALFTATSATCITGLSLFDTWSQWSGFGQVVILCLIQIGGLGFMSMASVGVFLLRKKVGLKQRLVMAQALSLNNMDGVVKVQKTVLLGSFALEAIGALVLTLRFLPEFGFWQASKWGIFHAISAFCNAGFDIFGSMTPGVSLMEFQSDPFVLITLSLLIIIGGLGFLVWEEVARIKRFKKFSAYTKLVLLTTLVLLLGGTLGICALEWNNPGTLGPMHWTDKLLNGFFQSVSMRTAGFFSVDQGLLTDGGKGLSILLMFVGGSSGSTAGGAKTVTVVVLLLFLWNRARGQSHISVFKRSIPDKQVLDAMTIVSIMVAMVIFGGIFITATSPVSLTDGLYESVSALCTVGVTAGATTSLSLAAKLLIIVYMYFGRVGILTISLGFLMGNQAEERFRYAKTNLLIG